MNALEQSNSRPRAGRINLNGPLTISLVAIVLTVAFVFSGLATMLSTALSAGTRGIKPAEEVGKLVALHNNQMQAYQDRFNGRSVFFDPPLPARPQPTQVQPRPEPEQPKIDEGPPKTYMGPGIQFAVGDMVYFKALSAHDKPLAIRVGEETSGVKVVSTDLPWSVKVGYKGGVYDVPIWTGAMTMKSFLLDQPKPTQIVPGLIEVPADQTVPTPIVTAAPDDGSAAAAAKPGMGRNPNPGVAGARGHNAGRDRAAASKSDPAVAPANNDRANRRAAPSQKPAEDGKDADEGDTGDDASAAQADTPPPATPADKIADPARGRDTPKPKQSDPNAKREKQPAPAPPRPPAQ